nr:toll/interleukin-1 receptor domain-containing protein [uncultured Azospirillum sp.]
MSYVGEPYEYDVFVSYARAEKETGAPLLMNWSQHVARTLRMQLASVLNKNPNLQFQDSLDQDHLRSGEHLSDVFQDRIRRSAVMLIMMSPYYVTSTWCREELACFFDQTRKDGRNLAQHCVVLLLGPVPDTDWPEELKDRMGKPVFYRDYVDDATELPIGIMNHSDPTLTETTRSTFIEIKEKLREIHRRTQARRDYQERQKPPNDVVLYLQADPEDIDPWTAVRTTLMNHAIVNPESLPTSSGNASPLHTLRDQRLLEYAQCDGMVLLRARNENTLRIQVMSAFKDRQRLHQKERVNLPWVIVDKVGGPLPIADTYQVPRVETSLPDWGRTGLYRNLASAPTAATVPHEQPVD